MPWHCNYSKVSTCEVCGKTFPFVQYPSQLKLGRGRFCSKWCQKEWQTIPLEIRFREYIGPTTQDGCVLWIGKTTYGGYGSIASGTRKGRFLAAHRVAWELANGTIPNGLFVLHRCDNPPCINVSHLFLGTIADNVADMMSKNRGCTGEKQGASKLKAEQVISIRRRYAEGTISQAKLAAEFDVSQGLIYRIINRQVWKHLTLQLSDEAEQSPTQEPGSATG